jgi:hypothetical protein
MPVFLASLLGGLIEIAGSLAGRVLIALGISVLTYAGTNAALDFLKVQAVASLSGLPSQVLGMLAVMKVGQCISIVFSAIVARQVQQGLTGDTIKKWVLK